MHVDADILLVDKPSGLLSVPGKSPAHQDCLEIRLQQEYPQARIVHRLDMDTSGVMVLAMNAAAHRHLGLQFERRHVSKTYQAIVSGEVQDEQGEINLPLICDWPNRPKQHVNFERGKPALTRWKRLSAAHGTSRLELYPETGRSHQLRVHLLELGHPILGDNLYAPDDVLAASPRLMLHAVSLTLHHPDGGERQTFAAELPF